MMRTLRFLELYALMKQMCYITINNVNIFRIDAAMNLLGVGFEHIRMILSFVFLFRRSM